MLYGVLLLAYFFECLLRALRNGSCPTASAAFLAPKPRPRWVPTESPVISKVGTYSFQVTTIDNKEVIDCGT